MSEHTKGCMTIIEHSWSDTGLYVDGNQITLISIENEATEENQEQLEQVASANARRLAAAWNACEGMETEDIEALAGIGSLGDLKASELQAANERIAKLETLVSERDAMLDKRPCQNSRCNELDAVRDLLREMVYPPDNETATQAGIRGNRAKDYLDACDTLEGK